ncbi:hypothetical protein OPAG_04763 [Rhodococcus opacus PD630]|nr:hypothetical protein OPAG_04763 [Rhodococcus opacus PD630]
MAHQSIVCGSESAGRACRKLVASACRKSALGNSRTPVRVIGASHRRPVPTGAFHRGPVPTGPVPW